MSTSTFFDRFYRLCRERRMYPNAVGAELGASSGSITAWKRGAMPRPAMIKQIAEYFGVTEAYLLGQEEARPQVSDEELKFALFGGDGEVTDAMLEEVRQFAAFLKQRNTEN